MNWRDEITLLEYKKEEDSLKSPYLCLKSSKSIFCDVLSVKRTEFYQAQAVGYKPEKVFKVKQIDFDEKYNYVKYNEKEYQILRTYEPNAVDIELTCIGKINEE